MAEFAVLLLFLLRLLILPLYSSSFTISSFHYPETVVKPYDSRYIRVDIPPGFSSMSLNLKSDVDIDTGKAEKIPKSKLPVICFRNGSPPLPDASNTSFISQGSNSLTNVSVGNIQDLQEVDCHPLQKNIMLLLTNEQITPGVWYVGLFNGIGPTRSQGKMIIRGSSFSFSANVSVEGCITSTVGGPYCNQTVVPLSCVPDDAYKDPSNLLNDGMYNHTAEIVTACRNSFDDVCHSNSTLKGYSLEIFGMVQQLSIVATNIQLNPTNKSLNATAILYARHGVIPSSTFHDYSVEISKLPLVIQSPKIGRWYISVLPANQTGGPGKGQDKNISGSLCYSLGWEVLECPLGKAGPNCTWEVYKLQTVKKTSLGPYDSRYLPIGGSISLDSTNFLLEPLLSNSSLGTNIGVAWTYFTLDFPRYAVGGDIHFQLKSDAELDCEIYARFGGLPSLDAWDYYYANSTSSSSDSTFFQLYDSSGDRINFYILYPKEGTWFFGVKHPAPANGSFKHQTTMSIASERCPRGCQPHGKCDTRLDASGELWYSFCSCDRDHGGFDCSIEIVTRKGKQLGWSCDFHWIYSSCHVTFKWHMKQSIALIASNAAAIFPAYYSLRKKAFAEWVLFTASGISSGLYHSCDVGTWCILSFRSLQFMDFWLSFMAVVSTFVYLTTIDDATKRTIHTIVAILTALMAITGATRSSNIVYVIAIGAVGLLIGWMIEASTFIRSISCSTRVQLNILERWKSIKDWFYNLIKTLINRFRWIFVVLGFAILSLAATSWSLETTENYWIWHSIWHVSIYTSSFFFLCSKVNGVNRDNQETQNQTSVYELTRQDSTSRGD